MSAQQSRAFGESLNRETLDKSDRAALSRIRIVSHLLDDAIRIPGTNIRFGLDPILGILPGAGDSAASVISLYIVLEGYRAGVPQRTLTKMLMYVGVDLIVGSVPILGTVFDAFWKANKRNVNLLESHFERKSAGDTGR
jgi:hypothetical protein